MSLTYGELKERAAAVAADLAAARSARNLLSRRKADEEQDEREAERGRRRQARKNERELEELLRRKVRIRVLPDERPRVGCTTARSLYHRAAGMLLGVTGLTDARGPDRLYSIHFAFTARGFASTKGRRWRRGEAERAARYIVREEGLERGELGWWSNIAADRNELVAFYRAVEALERHDRSNANVYISEVIALPAELSARQRRRAVRRICRFFEKRGLAYTVAIHVPDATGDQRNYHCHFIYSLRPCARVAPYEWSFSVAKEDDINTPDGIKARRIAAVEAINKTLRAAGVAKRYTHLSNKARGMAAAQAKVGQQRTWAARRLAATEARVALLLRVDTGLQQVIEQLRRAGTRLEQVRATARQALAGMSAGRKSAFSLADRLCQHLTHAEDSLAAADQRVGAIKTGLTERLGKVRGGAGDRLDRQIAAISAGRETSRLHLGRTAAADHIARTRVLVLERHTASYSRLQEAGTIAQRWLERAAREVPAISPARARLAAASTGAARIRAAETRKAALVEMLERLRGRTAVASAAAASVLLQIADDAKARSERNREGRIKLAGMGAVARLREEASRRRVLTHAIGARLDDHKVFIDRVRTAVSRALDGKGHTVASRLHNTNVRLAEFCQTPQLQRQRKLGDMLDTLSAVLRGAPDRLQAARDGVQTRIVGTRNEVGWAIRAGEAALRDLRQKAVRLHRLDGLTARAGLIQNSTKTSGNRLRSVGATTAAALTSHLAWVADTLAAHRSALERTKQNMKSLAKAAAEAQTPAEPDTAMRPVEEFATSANVAPASTVARDAPPGETSQRLAADRPGSAIEALRKLVPTRVPETDLHGTVLPSERGPLPTKKPSKVEDMWKSLRGDAKRRAPDVEAQVREHALRRLRVSKATITQRADGAFVADDRGLLAEERQLLRKLAQDPLVLAGLAELWDAQESRKAAESASAAAPAPVTSGEQDADLAIDVQRAFIARISRAGRAE